MYFMICAQGGVTEIGAVGNQKVTSKCGYWYQRLDGDACISCPRQQVSATSPAPASSRNQSQDGYFKLYTTLVVQDGGILTCACSCLLIVYRGTSVLLCGVSFISVVEPWCLIHACTCLVCFMQPRKTTHRCVIVFFISLWKLKFLAYLLNVTQHFVMRIISYGNAVYCICL
jgi:hypothetical protein